MPQGAAELGDGDVYPLVLGANVALLHAAAPRFAQIAIAKERGRGVTDRVLTGNRNSRLFFPPSSSGVGEDDVRLFERAGAGIATSGRPLGKETARTCANADYVSEQQCRLSDTPSRCRSQFGREPRHRACSPELAI